MANTRPIRTPRTPRWKRGRFRPSSLKRRWIEGNSHNVSNFSTCIFDDVNSIPCEPSTPRLVLTGDSDWEWADSSEVRVDRILGRLSWRSNTNYSGLEAGGPAPCVVRFGLLALEENETVFPVINLYDRESLEEYQWMWLYQTMGSLDYSYSEGSTYLNQYEDIDIDTATRRKLGKKDNVALYSQFAYHTSVPLSAGTVGLNPQYVYELRTIIRS